MLTDHNLSAVRVKETLGNGDKFQLTNNKIILQYFQYIFTLKDVLKVVGNLIYYRYINSAIVAPDVFGIIDKATLEDGGGLNPDQVKFLPHIVFTCLILLLIQHIIQYTVATIMLQL